MKRLISLFLFLVWLLPLTAQELVVKDKQYYLEKSKRQRTTGWVLAGMGTAMIVVGAITFNQNFNIDWTSEGSGGGDIEGWVMVLGVPVALSSIPFFVSASKNKGRAEMMAGPGVQPIRITDRQVRSAPGITITIRF